MIEVKINGISKLREIVGTPDLEPFKNVHAMVGGYGGWEAMAMANVEVKNLFAQSLGDGKK